MNPLERRCRWLLRAYPRWYRRQRDDEMLATLLEASQPGQRWPSARDVRALIHGWAAGSGRAGPAADHGRQPAPSRAAWRRADPAPADRRQPDQRHPHMGPQLRVKHPYRLPGSGTGCWGWPRSWPRGSRPGPSSRCSRCPRPRHGSTGATGGWRSCPRACWSSWPYWHSSGNACRVPGSGWRAGCSR